MLSPVPPAAVPLAPSFVLVSPPLRRGRTSNLHRSRYTCCTPLDKSRQGNDLSYNNTTARKVRLKRSDTCHSASWSWNGGSRRHHPSLYGSSKENKHVTGGIIDFQVPFLVRRMFKEAVRRVFSFQDADAIAGKLIRRVLQSLFSVLQRSWYAEELVIEYGITDPNPDDKSYVDPLRDWQPSPITYYHDSFGQRVYLSANCPNGLAIALEFRDYENDCDSNGEENGEPPARNTETNNNNAA